MSRDARARTFDLDGALEAGAFGGYGGRKALDALSAQPLQGGRKLMTLNMGPQHPSTHGVLRILLTLDGETVVDAQPVIGYLHRNFEKICEDLTYPMVVPFTDRNDYMAAMTNELAYVLTVEKGLGVEVPERAQYIRVIMAELQRICSHLLFYGPYALDVGAITPFLYAFREREILYDIFEKTTGARLLYNYMRVGGVRNDVPDDFREKTLEFLDVLESKGWYEYDTVLLKNRIFEVRTKGIGVLAAADAVAMGASGPILRASGVSRDLRMESNDLIYDRFNFDVPLGEKGDCYDRVMVRMRELLESAKIVRQALDQMPDGPVMGKVPRVIKLPAGELYNAIEGPRGEVGCYIVSDGGTKPYRLKWRAPSFVHLQLVPLICRGGLVADLVANVGSLDPIFGEVDR